MSQNIENALKAAIDRPPPYSASELADVAALNVTGDGEIEGFQLPNLTRLGFTGAGQRSIESLAQAVVPRLSALFFKDSIILDLNQLTVMNTLTLVALERCQATNASSLLELSDLRFLNVRGNPWDERSWLETFPELRRRGVTVKTSPEDEWKVTCEFFQRGIPASYDREILYFPVGYEGCGEHMFLMTVEQARELAEASRFEYSDVISRYGLNEPVATIAPESSEPPEHESGDPTVAKTWVDRSRVSRAEKDSMYQFINRFPTLHFQRDTAAYFEGDAQEADLGKPMHSIVRRSFETLSRFHSVERPGQPFEVYLGLSGFPELSPGELWWYLGMVDFGGDYKPEHLYPVAMGAGRNWLVFDVRSNGIGWVQSDDLMTAEPVHVIYSTYADLLDDVVRTRPPGERDVLASGR